MLDATSGRGAITLCQSYVGNIHLLVANEVMSDIGGATLASQARLVRPEMRVLLLSEKGDERRLLTHSAQPEQFFLATHFRPDTLTAKVRNVLDAPASTPLQ